MTSRQLSEWMIYLHLEPIGEMRDDFRAGMICSTVANYAGKTRSDGTPAAVPSDFMPSLTDMRTQHKPEPIQMPTPEAQAELIRNTLFGGQGGN